MRILWRSQLLYKVLGVTRRFDADGRPHSDGGIGINFRLRIFCLSERPGEQREVSSGVTSASQVSHMILELHMPLRKLSPKYLAEYIRWVKDLGVYLPFVRDFVLRGLVQGRKIALLLLRGSLCPLVLDPKVMKRGERVVPG